MNLGRYPTTKVSPSMMIAFTKTPSLLAGEKSLEEKGITVFVAPVRFFCAKPEDEKKMALISIKTATPFFASIRYAENNPRHFLSFFDDVAFGFMT